MRKKRKSKQDKVLQYLQTHKDGITQAMAIDKYRAYRLSGIIHRLRHNKGLNITTITETSKDKDGFVSNYARYVLHEG